LCLRFKYFFFASLLCHALNTAEKRKNRNFDKLDHFLFFLISFRWIIKYSLFPILCI
jgi:hypothetical protein